MIREEGLNTAKFDINENRKFDIVRGSITKPQQTASLIKRISDYFNNSDDEGTLYLSYPLTANSDEKITLDAMLLSKKRGMVVILYGEMGTDLSVLQDQQDEVYYHLEYYLRKYNSLRQGRRTVTEPHVFTYMPSEIYETSSIDDEYVFCTEANICELIKEITDFNSEYYKILTEALQKVNGIRPKKNRRKVVKQNSKGAIIKEIEKEVANLDQWQKKAALEVPEGPQRIRGLAGTGKTIVLALKAAYLHAQHPEWDILITYYTRSLKQQYEELVTKFVEDFSGDKPDWNHLYIMHAWGSRGEDGVYFDITDWCNTPAHTYSSARQRFGMSKAFQGICEELLAYMPEDAMIEHYDAVLIDEAQDLPAAFFKLVYKIIKEPRRIIWAYDELQNLTSLEMPSLSEMFGADEKGNSIINIDNVENEPKRDIVLPICYRNPPNTLALAHAFGFGIYNTIKPYPLQMFETSDMWKEIGYSIKGGHLNAGEVVVLQRNKSANPDYFERLLDSDSILLRKFNTNEDQYKWVSMQIEKNIKEEELDPDDILVVFPDAYTSKSEYAKFEPYLKARGIECFMAGINTNQDLFHLENRVTCSGIFRAKGNESPMVYIVNSEYCANGGDVTRLRNILFTAITRSRAWVRIVGVGDLFDIIAQEYQKCETNGFCLKFKYPTDKELGLIRKLNRVRSDEEIKMTNRVNEHVAEIVQMLRDGRIDPDLISGMDALIELAKKNEEQKV